MQEHEYLEYFDCGTNGMKTTQACAEVDKLKS